MTLLFGKSQAHYGDSPADIQALVGESVNVTARVAAKLRSVSDFDVT